MPGDVYMDALAYEDWAIATIEAHEAAPNCLDVEESSPTWTKNGDDDKDCGWVWEGYGLPRCSVRGTVPGTKGPVLAKYACPIPCGSPCSDSKTWHKNGEAEKTCAWVSSAPDKRCDVRGADGTVAQDACPDACVTML